MQNEPPPNPAHNEGQPPQGEPVKPPRRTTYKYTRKTLKEYRGKYGRPTLLTPELRDKICQYLRVGSYVETAVAAVGIHKDTFYGWMKDAAFLHRLRLNALDKGQTFEASDAEIALMEFSDAMEKAIAEAELADLVVIRTAANAGQWQAAAWRLERCKPQKYARRYVVEPEPQKAVEPEAKDVQAVDLSKMPLEKVMLLEELLTQAIGDEKPVEQNDQTKGQP